MDSSRKWRDSIGTSRRNGAAIELRHQEGFEPVPTPPSDRKIVVLVEQDARTRDRFQRILADAGFGVACFPDYLGALDEAESDRRLDLLITGLRLPPGTPHGLSLAAMIQLRRPRLPVLFVADVVDLALVADDQSPVLVKPVEAPALIQATTKLIGEAH